MERNSDFFRAMLQQGHAHTPRLRWQAATPAEHAAWRRRFRARLGQVVGRMPERVPLEVEWDEKVEEPGFTRHKIYVRTEANYWAPAFLFIPKGQRLPAPALVCLHGHSGIYPYIREGTEAEKEKGRAHELDYAPYFAEHGYVTIAPIQRGWNETKVNIDPHESGCQRMVMDACLMGQTPVGLRCWDASRLLDFLQTQEYVEPGRIGVAGLSGGGLVGLYWAALEPRVRVAMIAGFYCTMVDSIYSIYHCLCNCVPGVLEWGEMREIAALIAPRPLLAISGKQDEIFPIEATMKAYADLEPVYALLGATGNLDHDWFDGPHAWSNHKTLPFLAKHLPLRG